MWKTIKSCTSAIDANLWKAKLIDQGIEAKILDDKISSVYPNTGVFPLRVQVQDDDFIRAKRLVIDRGEDGNLISVEELEAEAMSHPHPDEAHKQKCPACKGTNISVTSNSGKNWVGKLLSTRIRRCECGYEWK